MIFGTTGGVMEAALRTAYYVLNGKNPDPDLFKVVRGMEGIKEEEVEKKAAREAAIKKLQEEELAKLKKRQQRNRHNLYRTWRYYRSDKHSHCTKSVDDRKKKSAERKGHPGKGF